LTKETIHTNFRNDEPIDRIYVNLFGDLTLVQANNTEYDGHIHKKSILVGPKNGQFKSHIYVTDDKRVFDRCGLPLYTVEVDLEEVEEENANES
tara:strand:- start:20 stop:301 length:282 start_codon:yes stop_codon:yes gene_type:complete